MAGVGAIAAFGAAARAVATNNGLLHDPFAEPLVRAVGVEHFVRVVADERYAGEDPALAAVMDILLAYTRCSDEFLAEAGRAGIRQVVILASGLDSRPYRLWWPHGTTVYEIERCQTLDFKAEVLRGLGATLNTDRCAVGIDFGQDWVAALHRVGFDAAQPTVWIAEQLLVGHLRPDQQHHLLQSLNASSAAGSRFAADHMPVWTPLQLEAEQAYVDGWSRHGVEVDLASLTHPGEYRYVPEHLMENGWQTTARDVVDLLGVMGLPRPRRGAFVPEYVTATLP